MRRWIVLVCLLSATGLALSISNYASAQDTSTLEERAQWAEVTHKMESAPLDDGVNKQGEAALKRLSDVHDVHVLLCPALLNEFNGMKYVYAHTIVRQYCWPARRSRSRTLTKLTWFEGG